jgi:transcription elongation factor GreA
MPEDVFYLTAEGAKKIKEELEYLTGEGREEIARRLRSAIQQGDLSENADYSSAKEDQAFLEGRVMEIETILHNAVIIDELEQVEGIVGIGSLVTIQEEGEPPETYHLVGPQEADPLSGRISHESPIGVVLVGKKVGDVVTAETPAGPTPFKIVRIENKTP